MTNLMSRLKFILVAVALPLGVADLVRADEPEPPHHHQPPPAAFDACQQKKEGDACQVTFHEHVIDGTCHATPDDQLFCRPAHPPGPPPELKAACDGKQEGDACQAALPDRTVSGTCRQGHHDDGLVCRGARPARDGAPGSGQPSP